MNAGCDPRDIKETVADAIVAWGTTPEEHIHWDTEEPEASPK